MLLKLLIVIWSVDVIYALHQLQSRSGFCGSNSEYVCGPEREVTCDTYGDDILEDSPCVHKCHCEEGFARNETGQCIPATECSPLRKCPLNSNYELCGPPCQKKCIPDGCQNDGKCYEGCFCRLGYVLDDEERRCIKHDECPKREDTKPTDLGVFNNFIILNNIN